MSLRYQIIIRILLLSLVILFISGGVAILQARHSVQNEVDASTHLALQLITLGIADTPLIQASSDLARLSSLQQTRHLRIQLKTPDGHFTHFAGDPSGQSEQPQPPQWFVLLVKADYPPAEHQVHSRDGAVLTLVIEPQPLDEISEAWQETTTSFLSSVILILLMFAVVNWVFNKALKPMEAIIYALQVVETGQYRYQLPSFSITEFDRIAKAINHMTLELDKTRQENRALTQHSLAIQEEERRHLSQELHDEFGQSLTAIKVMAVTANHQNADLAKLTQSISEICEHLMSVVRSMMQQLQPLILIELGLKAMLEEMVNNWSERHPGLSLQVHCDDAVDQLDGNIVVQLFRVIQESLTNVVRHAQAQQVEVVLQLQSDGVQLTVSDDGQGCDLATLNRGFGLLGMKERIRSLDGELIIESKPGEGLLIKAWVPL